MARLVCVTPTRAGGLGPGDGAIIPPKPRDNSGPLGMGHFSPSGQASPPCSGDMEPPRTGGSKVPPNTLGLKGGPIGHNRDRKVSPTVQSDNESAVIDIAVTKDISNTVKVSSESKVSGSQGMPSTVFRDKDTTVILDNVLFTATRIATWPQAMLAEKVLNHFNHEQIDKALNTLDELGLVRITRSLNKNNRNTKVKINTIINAVHETLNNPTIIYCTNSTEIPQDYTIPKKPSGIAKLFSRQTQDNQVTDKLDAIETQLHNLNIMLQTQQELIESLVQRGQDSPIQISYFCKNHEACSPPEVVTTHNNNPSMLSSPSPPTHPRLAQIPCLAFDEEILPLSAIPPPPPKDPPPNQL